MWDAACSFKSATVIWEPISINFQEASCFACTRPSPIWSVPHSTIPMKRRSLSLSMLTLATFSGEVTLTSCSVIQCCSSAPKLLSRANLPLSVVLLTDLNYTKTKAKPNKTFLSGVVLRPGCMTWKQDQRRTFLPFRASSSFSPLPEQTTKGYQGYHVGKP